MCHAEFFEELYGDLRGRFGEGPPVSGGHRVIFDVFLAGFTKENTTMALDQSALDRSARRVARGR